MKEGSERKKKLFLSLYVFIIMFLATIRIVLINWIELLSYIDGVVIDLEGETMGWKCYMIRNDLRIVLSLERSFFHDAGHGSLRKLKWKRENSILYTAIYLRESQ